MLTEQQTIKKYNLSSRYFEDFPFDPLEIIDSQESRISRNIRKAKEKREENADK